MLQTVGEDQLHISLFSINDYTHAKGQNYL